MKDLDGKELVINDRVVFNRPATGLIVGKIVGFTPKMVKVEFGSASLFRTVTVNPLNLAKIN